MTRRVDTQRDGIETRAAQDGWTTISLSSELGTCRTDRFSAPNAPSIALTRYAPVCDLIEQSDQRSRGRTLIIALSFDGESCYRCGPARLIFRGGFTTISSSCAALGQRYFTGQRRVAQLRLWLDDKLLTHYVGASCAEALLADAPLKQIAFHPTATASLGHAHILARQFQQRSPDLLTVHMHTLALLHDEVRRIRPQSFMPGRKWSDADIARIERAHELMERTVTEPRSIEHIASAVGMSISRLRAGFYLRYQRSPQQAMLDLRMRHAAALLERGEQVAATAYRVGYAHPPNFSAAFSRYFGRAPKSVARHRPVD